MIGLTFLLELLGLAACALSMDVHQRAVFTRGFSSRLRTTLRCAGAVLIGAALAMAVAVSGPGLGFVEWIIGLGVAGFTLTMLLASPFFAKSCAKTLQAQAKPCLIKTESQS